MSSAALDTSVVMRLLSGIPEAQAKTALATVTARIESGSDVFVSDLVVAEEFLTFELASARLPHVTLLKF